MIRAHNSLQSFDFLADFLLALPISTSTVLSSTLVRHSAAVESRHMNPDRNNVYILTSKTSLLGLGHFSRSCGAQLYSILQHRLLLLGGEEKPRRTSVLTSTFSVCSATRPVVFPVSLPQPSLAQTFHQHQHQHHWTRHVVTAVELGLQALQALSDGALQTHQPLRLPACQHLEGKLMRPPGRPRANAPGNYTRGWFRACSHGAVVLSGVHDTNDMHYGGSS